MYNIILEEFNFAVNTIAPVKRVQARSQSLYMDQEAIEMKQLLDTTLSEYIFSHDAQVYRSYKRERNKYTKHCKSLEKKLYQTKFSSPKNSWKFINSVIKDKGVQTPVTINDVNEVINKPKKIAQFFST